MVKTLHPIDEISDRISAADGHRVRLARDSKSVDVADADVTIDPEAAVVRALESPLDFPPFSAAIVPGDRVAIAVDEMLPCLAAILRGSLAVLQRAGVEAADVSVVAGDSKAAQLCREALSDNGGEKPQVLVHDPDDEANVCMVGVTRLGEPLVINRAIFDADVVLPIGVARLGGYGVHEGLYPRFSNRAAIGRYRSPGGIGTGSSAVDKLRETNEAGWLIGVPMVMQVVPGCGETVAHVVAGEPTAVAERCDELCRELWQFRSPQQVSLAIATITGGSPAQRWENVGRALVTAEQLLVEGGAVVICSNIDDAPGESLGRLIGSTDLERTERKILRDRGNDSVPAWHLARALQRGPVYFLSQLDAETVEDMGLAPVANVQEIVRLAQRHESCALIEDSQHAVVSLDIEENE